MRSRRTVCACVLLALAMAGCVTTTTEDPTTSEASMKDAARYNTSLGVSYMQQGNLELAREKLERAVKQDPRNPEAHSAIAILYERLGMDKEAEKHYREASRLAPRDGATQNTYAVFLCRQQRYKDARELFDRAAADPTYRTPEVALTNAGVCLRQEDPEAAEDYLRRALQRNPKYNDALFQITRLSYERGKYLQARAFLERYLAQAKATPAILYLGSQIETRLNAPDLAARYSRRLLKEFPESPEAQQLSEQQPNAG